MTLNQSLLMLLVTAAIPKFTMAMTSQKMTIDNCTSLQINHFQDTPQKKYIELCCKLNDRFNMLSCDHGLSLDDSYEAFFALKNETRDVFEKIFDEAPESVYAFSELLGKVYRRLDTLNYLCGKDILAIDLEDVD